MTPGSGNTIQSDLVKGVVRLCGGAEPGELGNLLDVGFTVDAEGYLRPGTEGEFSLVNARVDFGVRAFLCIGIVTEP